MIYRLDYFINGKWTTWGFYKDAEERKAVAEYIESISIPTGVNVFDLMDEPQAMPNDGTLVINVEDATKVGRVLVGDDKNRGGLYYPDYEDEPQTDCGDFADRLAYERGVKHAWEVAQKVFDSTVTFYEAEDVAKQIAKTEPQRDCFLCKWLGTVDVCGRCRNRNLFAEADTEPQTEPQTEVKVEPEVDCSWK